MKGNLPTQNNPNQNTFNILFRSSKNDDAKSHIEKQETPQIAKQS